MKHIPFGDVFFLKGENRTFDMEASHYFGTGTDLRIERWDNLPRDEDALAAIQTSTIALTALSDKSVTFPVKDAILKGFLCDRLDKARGRITLNGTVTVNNYTVL